MLIGPMLAMLLSLAFVLDRMNPRRQAGSFTLEIFKGLALASNENSWPWLTQGHDVR